MSPALTGRSGDRPLSPRSRLLPVALALLTGRWGDARRAAGYLLAVGLAVVVELVSRVVSR